MSRKLPDMLENTIAKIREMVDVNSVVGQPIVLPDGVSIIPVSKVSIGFGGAGSDFVAKNNTKNDNPFGGGVAAGVNVTPIAFLIVKEGNVLEHGRTILDAFHRVVPIPLGEEFYQELLPTIPKYVSLCDKLQALADALPASLKKHIEVKWLCYAMTLRCIYEWYVHIYEAKQYRQTLESERMKESLREACQCLEKYLEYRKCAEYGIFENWYRGDLKMDIKQKLYDTKRLLGQTPDFR